MPPLIKKNVSAGRLTFTTDLEKAVKESKVIFIAVGTSPNDDGSANLQQIEKVAQQIAAFMNEYKVIVNKSTVPIGTAAKIKEIINKYQTLSLRATEGSAAIPSSVIPAKASYLIDEDERKEARRFLYKYRYTKLNKKYLIRTYVLSFIPKSLADRMLYLKGKIRKKLKDFISE